MINHQSAKDTQKNERLVLLMVIIESFLELAAFQLRIQGQRWFGGGGVNAVKNIPGKGKGIIKFKMWDVRSMYGKHLSVAYIQA